MDANTPRRGTQRTRGSAARTGGCFNDTLARARRAAAAKRAQRQFAAPAMDGPPPEVEREMAAAAMLWRTLAAQGKELRFGRGEDGRVSIELTDPAGRPLDVIGASGLFRLLSQSSGPR